MSIEALIKVVPPPAEPREPYDGPWEPVEAFFGLELPRDYKDFVRVYGRGYFMEFLHVRVPRSSSVYSRIASQARVVTRDMQSAEPLNLCPYEFWPAPGGLLPFGRTDDGDEIFWHTVGPADGWPVVVWDRGLRRFERLDCGLTDFLARLAAGEVLPSTFPDDLLPCELLFQPSSP